MAKKNKTKIVNFTDKATLEMFDNLNTMNKGRETAPLPKYNNVPYTHRNYYNAYNLSIGDCTFMVPPEFIAISSDNLSGKKVTIRQENSMRTRGGYHKRTIIIDLVFHGLNQINGFKVRGPEGHYYVDGLRPLLAQFKCAPFQPIFNDMINTVYNIFAVALQDITIQTVEGFPGALTAQITLQEVNLFPYLQMPNIFFWQMIDWDLYRFFYQKLLTDQHEYKKLQELPKDSRKNHFKLKILDPSVFELGDWDSVPMLDILTDKRVLSGGESNYHTWVDSDKEDAVIKTFQCKYANILTNIQMAEHGEPTIQYMGGLDTIFGIEIETSDAAVVQAIEQCQITNDLITRQNIKFQNVGFVRLECELTEFMGSLFVMIENVTTNTVPGYAGLYNIRISCAAYDIAQTEREALHGFLPFKDRSTANQQAITQDWNGLRTKAKQDCYAEYKIRSDFEVYPDLMLPTYKEVDDVIQKIKEFRKKNADFEGNRLEEYPLDSYPRSVSSSLHGIPIDNKIDIKWGKDSLIDTDSIEIPPYDVYVDPDFYVFYPYSYTSMTADDSTLYTDLHTNIKRENKSYTVTTNEYSDESPDDNGSGSTSYIDDGGEGSARTTENVERFIELAKAQVGKRYVWGAKGPNTFDCSGLVYWCLKQINCIDRYYSTDVMKNCPSFEAHPIGQRQRGDLLWKSGHVVIYLGNDYILHAAGKNRGVVYEKHDSIDSVYSIAYKVTTLWREQPTDIVHQVEQPKVEQPETPKEDARPTISAEGWDNIRGVMAAECRGEPYDGQVAVAQCLYDRLTNREKKWGGLDNVLFAPTMFASPAIDKITDSITRAATAVFINGERWLPDSSVQYFLSPGASEATYKARDKAFDRLGVIGNHTFWGQKDVASSDIRFSVGGVDSSGSEGGFFSKIFKKQTTEKIDLESIMIDSGKKVGRSLLIETSESMTAAAGKFAKQNVNNDDNILMSSFYNMREYSGRGRLIRAFPTFLFCILDDNNQWYDGKKLWANFYLHKGLVDINVHATNDQPIETATVTITNAYHNLDRTATGLSRYKLANDKDYNKIQRWFYKKTGCLLGLGPKLTKLMIEMHTQIYDHALLREGARIHLRLGYGSDPMGLAPVMNGHISDLTVGESIGIVVISDGNELLGQPISVKPKDSNNGWFGLFGLGERQEASNMIAAEFVRRENKVINYLWKNAFEGSKYGIEHFGLYFSGTLAGDIVNSSTSYIGAMTGMDQISQAGFEIKTGVVLQFGWESFKNLITRNSESFFTYAIERFVPNEKNWKKEELLEKLLEESDGTIKSNLDALTSVFKEEYIDEDKMTMEEYNIAFANLHGIDVGNLTAEALKEIAKENFPTILYAAMTPQITSVMSTATAGANIIQDVTSDDAEQYDLLKNIYRADYDRSNYVYPAFADFDDEGNIVISNYNKPIWDLFQTGAQATPEYICQPTYHQFDSRMYFGLPTWMERFRYSYINGRVCEEVKSVTQAHFIDSLTDIVNNRVRVTSRYSFTNAKVLYLRGSTPVLTGTLYSDRTIDFSKQKTKIIDSSVVQDALGPDWLYEKTVYKLGKKTAKRIGISNLLYSWQNQYQNDILIFGDGGIRPNDYLMVNDSYIQMFGLSTVREVIHSFNSNTGFTTSVTPGMLAYATNQDSGLYTTATNYLQILTAWSSYMYARKIMNNNFQKNSNLYSGITNALYSLSEGFNFYKNLETWHSLYNTGSNITLAGFVAKETVNVYKAYKTIKTGGQVITMTAGITTFLEAANTLKAARSLKNALNVIKLAPAAANSIPVIGQVAWIVGWFVVDVLLESVFEYFENKNVLFLLPLWYENYPFVAGTKDGEHILPMGSNAIATEENGKDNSTDDPFEWEERFD